MNQRIMSAMIDVKIQKEVVKYCKENGLKVKLFLQKALIDALDKVGRYEKPKRPSF